MPSSTFNAYITGYSWQDNTPPGSAAVSHPRVSRGVAGGDGSWAKPITMAVGHVKTNSVSKLDYPPGTIFYIPKFQRYFIVEDSCGDGPKPQDGPCHTGQDGKPWLDVWVGGKGGTKSQTDAYMNSITGFTGVIMDPASDLPVPVKGDLFGTTVPTPRPVEPPKTEPPKPKPEVDTTRKIATYTQKRQMEFALMMHSEALSNEDDRQWHPGWSFDAVGKVANLTGNHARRLAKELGVVVINAPPPPSTEDRVATLEIRLDNLQGAINQLDIVLSELVKSFMGEPDASEAKEWAKSFGDDRRGSLEPPSTPFPLGTEGSDGGVAEPLQQGGGSGAEQAGEAPVPGATVGLLAQLETGRRARLPNAPAEDSEADQDFQGGGGRKTVG